MSARPALVTVVTALLAAAHGAGQAAQGGDQFLDGIGETSLTARYVLENNAEDASRNQFHATLRGTASFVGPTTMYAFMQAMGLVNDHIHGCAFRKPPKSRGRGD